MERHSGHILHTFSCGALGEWMHPHQGAIRETWRSGMFWLRASLNPWGRSTSTHCGWLCKQWEKQQTEEDSSYLPPELFILQTFFWLVFQLQLPTQIRSISVLLIFESPVLRMGHWSNTGDVGRRGNLITACRPNFSLSSFPFWWNCAKSRSTDTYRMPTLCQVMC